METPAGGEMNFQTLPPGRGGAKRGGKDNLCVYSSCALQILGNKVYGTNNQEMTDRKKRHKNANDQSATQLTWKEKLGKLTDLQNLRYLLSCRPGAI